MRCALCRLAVSTFLIACLAAAAHAALWEQLVPRKQVSADPEQEYTLTQENGPWLVMATSFNGENGKEQAEELVHELRGKFHLPAYYYGMTFQMEEANPGRGINDYGAPIKRRYNRGDHVVEHAVLVGEFPTIDDPDAQKLLKQIKQITPDALMVESGEENTQSLAGVRQLQNAVLEKINPSRKRGPMGHAFMTRNPILPKEYFVPQGIDAEVAKWNEGFEYSLMKCPGKYSIRVATFRGRTTFQTAKDEPFTKKSKPNEKNSLVEAAQNAHTVAVALRAKGWEAYEFHDRQESYVTVGSFEDGQHLEDGRIALTDREAQMIVRTFGAQSPNVSFEKPAYEQLGVKPDEARRIEQNQQLIQQQFANSFSSEVTELTNGLHPKRVVGVPLDIIPEPVFVPKKSISSAYARN